MIIATHKNSIETLIYINPNINFELCTGKMYKAELTTRDVEKMEKKLKESGIDPEDIILTKLNKTYIKS